MLRIAIIATHEQGLRLRDGDESEFNTIFNDNYKSVYRRALEILKNKEDAEEATQDVFVKLWRNKSKWSEEKGAFGAWVSIMAKNTLIDFYGKMNRRFKSKVIGDTFSFDVIPEDTDDTHKNPMVELLCDNKSPILNLMVFDEIIEFVEDVIIKSASPRARLSWLLRIVEGYSYKEISRILKCKDSTCRVYVYTCNKLIQKRILEKFGEDLFNE